jgi:hypothetical protein
MEIVMRWIARLLHAVLLVLVLATTSLRSATAQETPFVRCLLSVSDSIFEAQHIDPATASAEDRDAADKVVERICNSMLAGAFR